MQLSVLYRSTCFSSYSRETRWDTLTHPSVAHLPVSSLKLTNTLAGALGSIIWVFVVTDEGSHMGTPAVFEQHYRVY